MQLEMTSLHQNGIWDLVPLPPAKVPLVVNVCMLLSFTLMDLFERLKTRLVVKGYT